MCVHVTDTCSEPAQRHRTLRPQTWCRRGAGEHQDGRIHRRGELVRAPAPLPAPRSRVWPRLRGPGGTRHMPGPSGPLQSACASLTGPGVAGLGHVSTAMSVPPGLRDGPRAVSEGDACGRAGGWRPVPPRTDSREGEAMPGPVDFTGACPPRRLSSQKGLRRDLLSTVIKRMLTGAQTPPPGAASSRRSPQGVPGLPQGRRLSAQPAGGHRDPAVPKSCTAPFVLEVQPPACLEVSGRGGGPVSAPAAVWRQQCRGAASQPPEPWWPCKLLPPAGPRVSSERALVPSGCL